MKLSRIAGQESGVKVSYTFKQSTTELLERYRKEFSTVTKTDVKMKDLVEQMLLDFMQDDKEFQKRLRAVSTPTAAAATAASES